MREKNEDVMIIYLSIYLYLSIYCIYLCVCLSTVSIVPSIHLLKFILAKHPCKNAYVLYSSEDRLKLNSYSETSFLYLL